MALPDLPKTPITVLGVDDSAFRRGRHYGTVAIDMVSRRPIDMFNGRDGDSLAAWLRQHPFLPPTMTVQSGEARMAGTSHRHDARAVTHPSAKVRTRTGTAQASP